MKTRPVLYILAFLTLQAPFSCLLADEPSPARWSYKVVVERHGDGTKDFEAQLNKLGEEGWELVSSVYRKNADRTIPPGDTVHYFKRPVVSSEDRIRAGISQYLNERYPRSYQPIEWGDRKMLENGNIEVRHKYHRVDESDEKITKDLFFLCDRVGRVLRVGTWVVNATP